MAIISLVRVGVGQVDILPGSVKMISTDSLSAITTAGYLQNSESSAAKVISLSPSDVIECLYSYNVATGTGSLAFFTVSLSGGVFTLTEWINTGDVLLPVTNGHIASFNGTNGQIKDSGVSSTSPIFLGNVQAGASGTAGYFRSYPGAASNGYFEFQAVNNSNGFNSIVNNAAVGQTTTYSYPDPSAATANIVVDAGPQNVQTDHQVIIPASFQNTQFSTGTWTNTRIAQGDFGMVHTAAANSPIVSMNLGQEIRTTANKGFELTSISVISKVGTIALTSATPTINQIVYANNVANAVTQLTFSGTLSTATQANPYVDALTLSSPVYTGSNTNIILEITYVCQSTTALTFYGVILGFTRTLI